MASPDIKPLDGPGGYLRWKESLLLRAHTLGVARVLFEAGPDRGDGGAAKKWARDDAVCRGHILAALSDRLLPDYARFATAADLWRALERTYDVQVQSDWFDEFNKFSFDESTGQVFLEQHVEALGVAAGLTDECLAFVLRRKLPPMVRESVDSHSGPYHMGMELVWKLARIVVLTGVDPERLWAMTPAMVDYQEDPKQELNTGSRKRGMSGNVGRNCRRRA